MPAIDNPAGAASSPQQHVVPRSNRVAEQHVSFAHFVLRIRREIIESGVP
jgi:hypothetical protein